MEVNGIFGRDRLASGYENTGRTIQGNGERTFAKKLAEKAAEGGEKDIGELSSGEAMERFYEFVQDRIKNGPVKIRTGACELSVEEWDKLIEKIDEDIETVKQEQEEREDQQKKELNGLNQEKTPQESPDRNERRLLDLLYGL